MANRLKDRLLSGPPMVGVFGGVLGAVALEALATHGMDFILVDLEHAPNDITTMVTQLQAVEAAGGMTMVRAPWNDPVWIKRILDAGGQSIMVPYVQNAEEARRAVRAVRYPPAGDRGVALVTRGSRYGTTPDYAKRANDLVCLVVQAETAQAVDAIEEIGAVDGVDGIFIGPSDLAASMGHIGNPGHPDVVAKIAQGLAAAKKIGKPIGCLSLTAEGAAAQMKDGFAFSMLGTDLGFLVRQVRADVATLKAHGWTPRT